MKSKKCQGIEFRKKKKRKKRQKIKLKKNTEFQYFQQHLYMEQLNCTRRNDNNNNNNNNTNNKNIMVAQYKTTTQHVIKYIVARFIPKIKNKKIKKIMKNKNENKKTE